ncbi:hypothetical protein [Rhodanobacter thiooxydans]|uniref:hypothetical protein n=1 Tax=Rhodanobacter thiooxydans TaxID=416169 RepID=UPI000260E2E5|nr:hypothetical protein [Rhodanobacter thiooxydans]EIL97390.1 hypothetical protein UUA_14901 [Rhodanobacter thiooxydans LCS2]MCW0201840.1 hypothetical protein [Rhodanobacter thiooxydans]
MLTSDNSVRPLSTGAERTADGTAAAFAGTAAATVSIGTGLTGKGAARRAGAGVAGAPTTTAADPDPVAGCVPTRSNTRATPAIALAATSRRAPAHSGHVEMRARAHGTIRATTSRRKPAAAVTCQPSSGQVGGNSQRSVGGCRVRGDSRAGTTRERAHWAGAGITTSGVAARWRPDEPPDLQHAGAIR